MLLEGGAEEAEQALGEEAQPGEQTLATSSSSSGQEAQEQQSHQQEQVQRMLASIRQNFGKINVAPEFSEEDLVPVEMPDLPDTFGSEDEGSEENEGGSEDEDGEGEEEEETGGDEVAEKAAEEGPAAQAGGSKSKSAREVNRELDGKIAKLKHFLDRAKSKRFSAIRSVFHAYSPAPFPSLYSL